MESKLIKLPRFNGVIPKILIPVCISIAIYAIHKNPSLTESEEKLADMQLIIGKLLANGGQVIYQNDVAKFGGALSSRMIDANSLSDDQRKKDKEVLLSLGWRQVDHSSDQFCRNDVLLKFGGTIEGYYEEKPVVSILASFSARTKEICK